MRVLRAFVFLAACIAATSANAQGYGRGYSPYATRGYGFSARPYTHYQFNNGVSGYGIQVPHYSYYQFNNGVQAYGLGSRNFGYSQFSAPAYGNSFSNFPRVGF